MPDPMAKNLLSTAQAADLWNETIGLGDGSIVKPISAQTMRAHIRSGELQRLGVVVVEVPGRYYIKKDSLLYVIWSMAERACRRAEASMGITFDDVYANSMRLHELVRQGEVANLSEAWVEQMRRTFAGHAETDEEDAGKERWGEVGSDG